MRRETHFQWASSHTEVRWHRILDEPSTKNQPRAVLCRTGKIPGRDHQGKTSYKRLGTLTEAKTSASLAVAREIAKILEVDPNERESKRFARDFSRWSVG